VGKSLNAETDIRKWAYHCTLFRVTVFIFSFSMCIIKAVLTSDVHEWTQNAQISVAILANGSEFLCSLQKYCQVHILRSGLCVLHVTPFYR
jgi:hypothetical protein